MNQLSLYDFLSFFLPGVLATEVLKPLLPAMAGAATNTTDVGQIPLLLAVALITGLSIHTLTHGLLRVRPYRSVVAPGMATIVAQPRTELALLRPWLQQRCVALTGKELPEGAGDLFNYAYYFLETRDKIGPAKTYQAMYFFCRNVLSLALCCVLYLLYLLYWQQVVPSYMYLLLAAGGAAVPVARMCRLKMTERVLWGYYVLQQEPEK